MDGKRAVHTTPDEDRRGRIETVLRGLVVTIDGPAGSGKSTTASILAARLGFAYLDTGAMYRAVTLAALERGIDPNDGPAVTRLAETLSIEAGGTGGGPAIRLDGRAVDREIRGAEVSRFVSPVSRHEGVRRAMVKLQRRAGARGGVVAEGRDTGSVVFPFAASRVFLVADAEARARRREAQLRSMGIVQDIEAIRDNIRARDAMDSGRAASPLVRPAGAFLVDTSTLSVEEQVGLIEAEIRSEAGRIADAAVMRGERNPFAAMRPYYRASRALVRAFFRGAFGLEVRGAEHLRFRENYIFASNHMSYADPPVVGCALDREVWFLAKKELFRNPLFARLIGAYHAIPVDREEIERKTMKGIFEILARSGSILMFPEGTRSRTGELRPLKPGLGYAAVSSGVAIAPVYVTGTNDLGRCLLRRRRLRVVIGPPIRLRADRIGEDRKREYRILTAMAASELEMLRDEARD